MKKPLANLHHADRLGGGLQELEIGVGITAHLPPKGNSPKDISLWPARRFSFCDENYEDMGSIKAVQVFVGFLPDNSR